jgi:phosphoribosylformylglycinamidine cyclo-ligase
MNDMYCNNGTPIALLDYYGCDKLNKVEFDQFIEGALSVCREYGIALIGGETAEMRGIFTTGEVEVLGILLGIVNGTPDNGTQITRGAYIYALSSNGAHTNGFTKLRAVDSEHRMPLRTKEFFSQPHKNYIPIMKEITRIILEDANIEIVGKAHITGGGFQDNIERILPDSSMKIELQKWDLDQHWEWLFKVANLKWDEFIRVFNAGWGFCFITNQEIPALILDKVFHITKENIKMIGRIV